ncbi:hypothetical protein [Polymorphospora sp. NPDC050346]|uniref:hypothetical protein n=1 Tax=Polymorphospora sp. NPDC050346 TaxID=3155780 RepID=UPI0033FA9FA9
MGKRNRGRTRAIRAEMAQTGENYTRAAAAAGGRPAKLPGRAQSDVVRDHIVRLLEENARRNAKYDEHLDELERLGHRFVDGGQTGHDTWEIRDWPSGELIAKGDGGYEGYDAAVARLDPDEKWLHIDHVGTDIPWLDVDTAGLPGGLGEAIEQWVNGHATDEEIAEFIGWPVDKVKDHR